MIRKEVGFSDKHRTHPATPVLQDGETFLAKLMGSRNVPSNRSVHILKPSQAQYVSRSGEMYQEMLVIH